MNVAGPATELHIITDLKQVWLCLSKTQYYPQKTKGLFLQEEKISPCKIALP